MSGALAASLASGYHRPTEAGRGVGMRETGVQDARDGAAGPAEAAARADERRAGWMAAAQAGDGAAYAALLRDCLPLVRSVVRRQGVPSDAVEDAVQDVLLTLHRVRHTYDPARSFDAWIAGIARHRAIDLLRRSSTRGRREAPAGDEYEAHPDGGDAPDTRLVRSEIAARVRAAVARLPDGQREAVEHLALAELSLTEAAVAANKTKVALKVSLHRGLRSLRRLLAEDGTDG